MSKLTVTSDEKVKTENLNNSVDKELKLNTIDTKNLKVNDELKLSTIDTKELDLIDDKLNSSIDGKTSALTDGKTSALTDGKTSALIDGKTSSSINDKLNSSINSKLNANIYVDAISTMMSHLSHEQKKVVYFNPCGNVRILACAGSGKTTTMNFKIVFMMIALLCKPEEFFIVTFTKNAAMHICKQIEKYLKDLGALVDSIKKKTSNKGSIKVRDSKDNVIDKGVSSKDMDNLINNETKDIEDMISNFNIKELNCGTFHALSRRILNANDILTSLSGDNTYNIYNVDELQYYFLRFLKAKSKEALEFKSKIKHIFVDEFQDVNDVQYEIVKELSKTATSVTVIGDDNQNIYSFRGSNIRYIQNFHVDFPNLTTFYLSTNYRSTHAIVNLANESIKNNVGQLDKPKSRSGKSIDDSSNSCLAKSEHSSGSVLNCFDNSGNINSDSLEMINDVPTGLASLQSSSGSAKPLEQSYGSVKPLEQSSATDPVNCPPNDVNSKSHLSPSETTLGGIISNEVIALKGCDSMIPNLSLSNINNPLPVLMNTRCGFEGVNTICNEIQMLIIKAHVKPKDICILSRNNYLLYAAQTNLMENGIKCIFFSGEDCFSRGLPSSILDDCVVLSTIHSAKGLEWEYVYIIGLHKKYFPSDREIDIERERRLFYVALTRSRMYLTLSNSFLEPSIFVTEIPPSGFFRLVGCALPAWLMVKNEDEKKGNDDEKTKIKQLTYIGVVDRIRLLNGGHYIQLKEDILPRDISGLLNPLPPSKIYRIDGGDDDDSNIDKDKDENENKSRVFPYYDFISKNMIESEFGVFLDCLARRMIAEYVYKRHKSGLNNGGMTLEQIMKLYIDNDAERCVGDNGDKVRTIRKKHAKRLHEAYNKYKDPDNSWHDIINYIYLVSFCSSIVKGRQAIWYVRIRKNNLLLYDEMYNNMYLHLSKIIGDKCVKTAVQIECDISRHVFVSDTNNTSDLSVNIDFNSNGKESSFNRDIKGDTKDVKENTKDVKGDTKDVKENTKDVKEDTKDVKRDAKIKDNMIKITDTITGNKITKIKGTIDLLIDDNIIIDFKNSLFDSDKCKLEYFLQVLSYAAIWKCEKKKPIKAVGIYNIIADAFFMVDISSWNKQYELCKFLLDADVESAG